MIAALKNAGEVEVEILMSRQAHSGPFLVLEGPDDSRFWGARVRTPGCEIVVGGGKQSVVGAIRRLDMAAFRGALGLVDDDCDRLLNVPSPSPNVVPTDTRDLEGVLFRSSAFQKLLSEYGVASKVRAFETKRKPVIEALLDLALPFGRLRWLAYKLQKDVNFNRLRHRELVASDSWTLDESALWSAVDSQALLPTQPRLQVELAALESNDPWQVCQGHDLVELIGIGFERVLGNGNPGREKIASVLRAGLEQQEFAALQLCASIRNWEQQDPRFQVLP